MSDTNIGKVIMESMYNLYDLLSSDDKASVNEKLSAKDTSRYDIHKISDVTRWIIANPPSHNDTTFDKYYERYVVSRSIYILSYVPKNIFSRIVMSLGYGHMLCAQ